MSIYYGYLSKSLLYFIIFNVNQTALIRIFYTSFFYYKIAIVNLQYENMNKKGGLVLKSWF